MTSKLQSYDTVGSERPLTSPSSFIQAWDWHYQWANNGGARVGEISHWIYTLNYNHSPSINSEELNGGTGWKPKGRHSRPTGSIMSARE